MALLLALIELQDCVVTVKKIGKLHKSYTRALIDVLVNISDNAFYVQLSKRIRELRKAKGFKSYETFAYDIEISRSAMSKYESGIGLTNIEMETLLKIMDGFEMKPSEFFSKGFD
jgi:predicted transcriptional regulator